MIKKLIHCLSATWPAPLNVRTLITTRHGGFSQANYSSFNLATHVGDDKTFVIKNRQLLQQVTPSTPIWLNQTHSNNVLQINSLTLKQNVSDEYDAIIITQKNTVGVVMTADCAPVLVTDINGSFVGAIHVGWKGLYNGIISKTIKQLNAKPEDILIYIGPTICKEHFEIGRELYQDFIELDITYQNQFTPYLEQKYLCDIVGIAEIQLLKLNIKPQHINKSKLCTYCNNDLFYSYRKEGVTGRIASLIWLE